MVVYGHGGVGYTDETVNYVTSALGRNTFMKVEMYQTNKG